MEKQNECNNNMKFSRNKLSSFKVDDYVTTKIDKVDKVTPFHPNVGKILSIENNYAKVVTKFGVISTNRLNKCTRTNILFDFSKEIPFSTTTTTTIFYSFTGK